MDWIPSEWQRRTNVMAAYANCFECCNTISILAWWFSGLAPRQHLHPKTTGQRRSKLRPYSEAGRTFAHEAAWRVQPLRCQRYCCRGLHKDATMKQPNQNDRNQGRIQKLRERCARGGVPCAAAPVSKILLQGSAQRHNNEVNEDSQTKTTKTNPCSEARRPFAHEGRAVCSLFWRQS